MPLADNNFYLRKIILYNDSADFAIELIKNVQFWKESSDKICSYKQLSFKKRRSCILLATSSLKGTSTIYGETSDAKNRPFK